MEPDETLETEEARRADLKAQIEQWAAASSAVVEEYGSPSDEYSPF